MKKRRLIAVAGLVALLGATAVHPPVDTEATWVQREFGSATVTAATVGVVTVAPTCANGTGLLRGATVSWPAATGSTLAPSGYVLEVLNSAGAVVTNYTTSATERSVLVSGGLLGGLLQAGTYTFVVYATNGTWRSPAGSPGRTATLALLVGWTCS